MLIVGVLLLATPFKVTVNGKSPAGNPLGSLTTIYEAFNPATPDTVPTFSTVSDVPPACTVSDGPGALNPRLDVNKITRV